jgi:uncharacterized membrane protein
MGMNVSERERRRPHSLLARRLALAAILALGALLRFHRLDAEGVWYDEAGTLLVAAAPIGEIVRYFSNRGPELWFEFNPPVYFYTLHGWFELVGANAFHARLFSALAGVASIAMLFAVSRRLFDPPTALLAALLLAVSNVGVALSQEARNYALLLLLFLITWYLILRVMAEPRLRFWWAAVAVAILTIGTHYYGAFSVLVLAGYVLARRRAARISWTWIVAAVVVGAAVFLPWLAFAFHDQFSQAASGGSAEWPSLADWLLPLFTTMNRFNNGAVQGLHDSAPLWAYAVGAALFTVPAAAAALRRRKPLNIGSAAASASVLCVALWLVPMAFVLALSLVNVQLHYYYMGLCIAPYYLLVASTTMGLPSAVRRTAIALMLAFSAIALHAHYSIPHKENYRDAVRHVVARSEPDDCYAFVNAFGPSIPVQWSVYSPRVPAVAIDPSIDRVDDPACRRIWVITSTREPAEIRVPARWKAWRQSLPAARTRLRADTFFWVDVELYGLPGSGA